MRRTTWVVAVALAVVLVPNALAVCRTDPTSTYDVSTLKLSSTRPDINANLFDYGIIFEDSNEPSCAGFASVALYKKVRATLNHPYYKDPRLNNKLVGPYQGWLEGGNVALVYASALRLGPNGKLTKPLADLLDQISYVRNIDADCGFTTNRKGQTNAWTQNNSCMDDWSIAASGHAWTAAWRYARMKSSTLINSAADAAKTAISNALNITESVCVHKYNEPLPSPAPAAGPCTGQVADLNNSNVALALGLHDGEAVPYGLGLLTSIANADVALDYARRPKVYSADEKTVAAALYLNGDYRTTWTSGSAVFKKNCYKFGLVGTTMTRTATYDCSGNFGGGSYQPEMFPVRDFLVKRVGITAFAFNYDFTDFQSNLFCDNPANPDCIFWSPGRRAIYGTLARDWVNARPHLEADLSDYQVTFKTYDGVHYLSARYGGGNYIHAEATAPSTYETFSMVDENGGSLMSGDTVYMQVHEGQYISADQGGGGDVVAVYFTPVIWERFIIEKTWGTGQIVPGDPVALKTLYGYYVSAVNEGGGEVTARYRGVVTWEVFTIDF
ncbi:MAG TPA: hypothetical protein VF432_13530 [Thermoanaerobaculia bacterium]